SSDVCSSDLKCAKALKALRIVALFICGFRILTRIRQNMDAVRGMIQKKIDPYELGKHSKAFRNRGSMEFKNLPEMAGFWEPAAGKKAILLKPADFILLVYIELCHFWQVWQVI